MTTQPSNSGNTSTPPGLMKPTQIGMIGSTPKDSAIMAMNNMNQKQSSLSNAVGGKRRRFYRKGGAVVVPQYNMPYAPQNGPGQSPNNQIVNNSQNSMQSTANSVYDSQATVMTGGVNNVKWGCYSGGKQRKSKSKRRKTRKTKSKTRKTKSKKRKTKSRK